MADPNPFLLVGAGTKLGLTLASTLMQRQGRPLVCCADIESRFPEMLRRLHEIKKDLLEVRYSTPRWNPRDPRTVEVIFKTYLKDEKKLGALIFVTNGDLGYNAICQSMEVLAKHISSRHQRAKFILVTPSSFAGLLQLADYPLLKYRHVTVRQGVLLSTAEAQVIQAITLP